MVIKKLRPCYGREPYHNYAETIKSLFTLQTYNFQIFNFIKLCKLDSLSQLLQKATDNSELLESQKSNKCVFSEIYEHRATFGMG